MKQQVWLTKDWRVLTGEDFPSRSWRGAETDSRGDSQVCWLQEGERVAGPACSPIPFCSFCKVRDFYKEELRKITRFRSGRKATSVLHGTLRTETTQGYSQKIFLSNSEGAS